MILLAIFVGLGGWVVYTGPALDEYRQRRKESKDFPKARVEFLLPSAGRSCKERA